MILVLDFGSQYTQLISKTYRRLGFECEVISGKWSVEDWKKEAKDKDYTKEFSGVILSGSPASVGLDIEPDNSWFESKKPILGICFGYQYLATKFGGEVSSTSHREYGSSKIRVLDDVNDVLLDGVASNSVAWMSHGDSVIKEPDGSTITVMSGDKIAGFVIPDKKVWGLQFHPEVYHSAQGEKILHNFAARILALEQDWSVKDELKKLQDNLREEFKDVPVIYCGASGGVDSTVMVALLSQFAKVKALYVDHGFQRAYDLKDLKSVFKDFPNVDLEVIEASEMFWKELDGVSDPETKRKIMGRLFIDAFYSAIPNKDDVYLGQGTIYSDVIESAQNNLASSHMIKSHHNVGGLPADLKAKLVEPLRHFFKDEVRQIGRLLGIKEEFLERHPFPGPGLSIRCVGELRREKVEILRKVDEIFHDELIKRDLYSKTWQALAALLPVQAVGVMGDGRTYEWVVALRAVSSVDAMTAEATEIPWPDLQEISSRVVNEVRGVNRVLYDMTSKPPGTIEFE